MAKIINLREIKEPNSCANCSYLRWGQEEGWDLCSLDGHSVDWAKKCRQICDDHVRSKARDPRNADKEKFCQGCGAPISQESVLGPDNEAYNEYKCGSRLWLEHHNGGDHLVQTWSCKKIQELKERRSRSDCHE